MSESETYKKLTALLKEKKKLTNEDVEKMIAEHGEMDDKEKMQLEADRLDMAKEADSDDKVTMDQYLEACKMLDTADEGSDEYQKAEAIVEKYESGM